MHFSECISILKWYMTLLDDTIPCQLYCNEITNKCTSCFGFFWRGYGSEGDQDNVVENNENILG